MIGIQYGRPLREQLVLHRAAIVEQFRDAVKAKLEVWDNLSNIEVLLDHDVSLCDDIEFFAAGCSNANDVNQLNEDLIIESISRSLGLG